MIAIPAVDIREGYCVQLAGGDYEREMVRLDDPVGVARDWSNHGFVHLHVVDLDAALGKGSNAGVVDDIIASWPGEVQVGGGVRSADRIDELLQAGATRVIVGTRAIEDVSWLGDMTRLFPGRLVVAADTRGRNLVSRGWTTDTAKDVVAFVKNLDDLELAAAMVTAVHREGLLGGAEVELMSELTLASRHPIQASGGVSGIGDLRNLAAAGVSATIIGMAIYTGALDAHATATEFGQ